MPYHTIPNHTHIHWSRPVHEMHGNKLDTGQGVLGLVAPEDLLSACCLDLSLVLSALVSDLSWTSLGGHFWISWRPLALQDLSWASPALLLAPPGSAALGPLLGRSWAFPGFWGPPALGPLLGTLELSFGPLGGLVAAKADFSRKPAKTIVCLNCFWCF